MQKEGGKEKEKITQWTRYLTIIIAILQSIGIIVLLESQGLVIEPGMMFNIQTITLITGGTAFLMWVVISYFVYCNNQNINQIIKSIIISFLILIPNAILIGWNNPIGVVPVIIMTLILSILMGFITGKINGK